MAGQFRDGPAGSRAASLKPARAWTDLTPMSRPLRKFAILAAIAASAIMAGCSCSIGKSSEEKADPEGVELQISSYLAEQSGVPPSSVSCPEEMVQEEGRHYECSAVHPQEGAYVVDVTMHDDQGFKWLTRPLGQ